MPRRHRAAHQAHPFPFAIKPLVLGIQLLVLGGAAVFAGWAPSVHAQAAPQADAGSQDVKRYDIPAGPLSAALLRFSSEAGVFFIGATEQAQGKNSPGLQGAYTVQGGLAALLAGTGLQAVRQADDSYGLRQVPASPSGEVSTLSAVQVKGSSMRPGELPEAYAGGQVARGSRIGLLGNQDFMDTPFSTTSYTSQTIANLQATTVTDVLVNDPSIGLQTPRGHNISNFTMRGFLVQARDITINGMGGLMPDSGLVPTEFLERVEVMRGPGALVRGIAPSGTIGGTINLVAKRAEDIDTAQATVGYASDSRLRTHVDLGRRWGESSEWGARVNVATEDGDTPIDGQSIRNRFAALALDYRGKDLRVSLDAFARSQKIHGGMAGQAIFGTYVPDAPPSDINLFKGIHVNQENYLLQLQGEYDLNDHWTAYAGFGRAEAKIKGSYSGTFAGPVAPDGSFPAGASYSHVKNDWSSMELGLRGQFKTGGLNHQLVLGANRIKGNQRSADNLIVTRVPSNLYDPVPPNIATPPTTPILQTSDPELSSIALADTISMLDDRLIVTGGLRWQKVKSHTWAGGAATSLYDETAITPMFGIVGKVAPGVSLDANYIEGLSPGTEVGVAYNNAGEVFPPYKSRQVEAGVKWELDTMTHTLSWFQIRQPSTIVDASTTPLPTLALVGEQRNRGLEWQFFGEVTPSLRVLGGVVYTDARQVTTANGANDGNVAVGVPKWRASAGVEWDVPGLHGLTLSARVTHASSQYVNAGNTLKIPHWERYDVGARYVTRVMGKTTTIRATVENLLNDNYWEGSTGRFQTLSAPRTFLLSATMEF